MIRVWLKDQPFGVEIAEVRLGGGTLSASGAAIGTEPRAYRLEYDLTTTRGYVTGRLSVRTRGDGWSRTLDLERAGSGRWSARYTSEGAADLGTPGGDLDSMAGALDVDLGLSPLTNSMPVLRHALHLGGGPTEFLMAWVSVPDLSVQPSRQRYTFLRQDAEAHVVRYESVGGTFTAEIAFDADGIVLDYPGIARRVA
jgi:hypothetical protein